jgi:hypothetical protein
LERQGTFGLKEKECFMLYTSIKTVMVGAGLSSTKINMLKPKHSRLKNEETSHHSFQL